MIEKEPPVSLQGEYDRQIIGLAREYIEEHTQVSYQLSEYHPPKDADPREQEATPIISQEVTIHPYVQARGHFNVMQLTFAGSMGSNPTTLSIHRDAKDQGATITSTSEQLLREFSQRFRGKFGQGLGPITRIIVTPGYENVQGELTDIAAVVYETIMAETVPIQLQ